MGQREIIEFLEANPEKWVDKNEIADDVGLSRWTVRTLLQTLTRWGDIQRRPDPSRRIGKGISPFVYAALKTSLETAL